MESKNIKLVVKEAGVRRLRAGALWIYSNELEGKLKELKSAAGTQVVLQSAQGEALARAYFNPNSLIAARVLSLDPHAKIDHDWLSARMRFALAVRTRLGKAEYGRQVFGESDGLPGLVLDRIGDLMVGQIGTAGMDALKADILSAVQEVYAPKHFIWKNEAQTRALEGLASEVSIAWGEPRDGVELIEGGVRFAALPVSGQKTGWFFDQAFNRELALEFFEGQRVLDAFCYLGGWGVRAACAGAREVLCLDASAKALEGCQRNAGLNGVAERLQVIQGDAFDALKQLAQDKRRFDVVVIDPPALIKRKKDHAEGSLAYRRLAEAGLKLVPQGGILIMCSCSHHLSAIELLELMQRAAARLGRRLLVLKTLAQSPDHPILASMPETAYLKGFLTLVD